MHRTGYAQAPAHLVGRIAKALGPLVLAVSILVSPVGPGSASASVASSWMWPLPDPHVVVRGWQAPADDYSAGHRGIDIAAATGTVVVAPESGTVHFAGRVVDRLVVSIAHPGGLVSSYEPLETALKQGDSVTRGQQIGTISSSAHCAGPCLHLGVRRDGRYVSPLLLLESRMRAILLPVDAGGRLTPAGAPAGRSLAVSLSSRGCRSGWFRDSRAPASPAPRAGRRPRREDGWQPCA